MPKKQPVTLKRTEKPLCYHRQSMKTSEPELDSDNDSDCTECSLLPTLFQ